MRILVAEDEIDLAEALSVFFEKNQYIVDVVHDGAAACDHALTGMYDAIILDVMMPKMDGIQVLKKLRQGGITIPIMILTAKAEKSDRILGFDMGADDYLPKPFAPDELLSRVRAMLRRRDNDYTLPTLTFGDIALNSSTCELCCNMSCVKLSGKEFQVMELFISNPKTIFSTDRIMERIWGWDSDAEVNVVWVYISNLRKKLKSIGSETVIRVSRGLGYSLEVKNDP